MASPDQFGTGGVLPHMLVTLAGNVGVATSNPSQKLHVVGNILATGSITGSSKSFSVVHPDPTKAAEGYHLRHFSTESDDIGGSVQYRRTIDMNITTQTLEMPSWFSHLTKDVVVMVTPYRHFGSAWGECDGNTITIHATTLGLWHVLITASRKDHCALHQCPKDIEFIPEEAVAPEEGSPSFP